MQTAQDIHHHVIPALYYAGYPNDNQAVQRFAYDGSGNLAAWTSGAEAFSMNAIFGGFRHAGALVAFFSWNTGV